MNIRQRTQKDDFIRRLVLMKEEAMRVGLPRTCHALEAATREAGWELADICEGKQVDISAKEHP